MIMLFFFLGLNRSAFDNKTVSFEEHIKHEHNMWHYLYFIVLVKVKDPTEFTGPESYVYAMVKVIVHRAWKIWAMLISLSSMYFHRIEIWSGSQDYEPNH